MAIEKDIKLGSEGDVNLKLEGGKLVVSLTGTFASGTVGLVVTQDIKYFLEKLKVAIPGNWDDLVINIVEGSLP